MKFLWLDINASYSHSSLALPALEAQVPPQVNKQIEWKVVPGTIKSSVGQIVSQVISHNPNYIFATGWLFNINYLLSVLRRVNAIIPDAKIVLGGPEFLGNNDEFLRTNKFVTAVFKGDGEDVFAKMAEILVADSNSTQWLSLPGFEYLDNINYIRKQPAKAASFTTLVPPEQSQFFNWEKAFVQIETSRGCFNSCRFCVSGIDCSPVEDIPVNQIRERLQKVADKGIKEVRILDRTFNANVHRAIELIELFEEFNGRLKFHLEVHPAMLNPQFKEKLSSVPENLLHIEAGIQSLNDDVISNCRRKGKCSIAVEGLKYLLSVQKFEVHTDFIAGLPGYSYNNLVEDIRTMISINPQEIQLELLKLLPGTYFRYNASDLGIKYSTEPPYEVLQTNSISFDELRKSMVISKIIEYWYNDPSWRSIFTKIAINEPEFLHRFADDLMQQPFMEHTFSYESKSMMLYNWCKNNCPQYLSDITLGWIHNGLSVKKEPACGLKMWHFDDNTITNPVLDANNNYNSYYFIDIEDTRHWFVYNKNTDRHKPITYFKEKLQNS
ncbi:MAG: DUF4080 domain-containing protein [Bacteroidales bacterium]|nr:DUF4080 domain-containing protein [Bacteroidales bacterium]